MNDDEKGPGEPGSPFCPANGTEGMLFFEGWCGARWERAKYDRHPVCPDCGRMI